MTSPPAPPARIGPTRVPPILIATALALTGAVTLWASWPLGSAEVATPAIASPATLAAETLLRPLDVDAFRTPVWVAAAATAEPIAAAPPPPLRIQLLAILREVDGYKAALYDPDSDRLLIVKAGDQVARHTIETINAAEVALRDDRGLQTLSLRGAAP